MHRSVDAPTSDRWVLRSRRVATPEGVRPADIVVEGGLITGVHAPRAAASPATFDVGDLVVLPGGIDAHVHINDPGRADWEGFDSATRAAAAGGVTTICDMPLNSSPVTTNAAALEAKIGVAAGRCWVDVALYAGLVPENASPNGLAWLDDRVFGVKAFLCDSGLDEFPAVSPAEVEAAMPTIARAGLPLLVHAELLKGSAPLDASTPPARVARYRDYCASRPPAAETRAIEAMIECGRRTGCAVHIVHLAAAEALPLLAAARASGLALTVETCPHYLCLDQDQIADGDTRFKCAPPIRDAANRDGLWHGLAAGTIDIVASDHSPCPPAMKRLGDGDFARAWGGISSLELGLPLTWSEACRRGFSIDDVVRWRSAAPARYLGLGGRKGEIAEGCDADLVVFDPDAEWIVRGERLFHRHPLTPYEGRRLVGRVRHTFLRGVEVFGNGRHPGPPNGDVLRRPAHPESV